VLKNLEDCGPGVVKPNDSKGLVGTSRTLTKREKEMVKGQE
jgi:hypothetical protein